MIKKSVKHFLNLICTLVLSLCFALSFSVSSYAVSIHNFSIPVSGSATSSFVVQGFNLDSLDDSFYNTLGGSSLAHCSFDLVPRFIVKNNPSDVFYSYGGTFVYTIYIDIMDVNLAAYRVEVLNGSSSFYFARNNGNSPLVVGSSYNFPSIHFEGDVQGTPVGVYCTFSLNPCRLVKSVEGNYTSQFSIDIPSFNFTNVSILNNGSGGGDTQKVEIEYSPEQISTNGLMSTNGFSPLILATNGNVRYFGNLGTYNSKFGYPAFNMSDFESGSSAPLTFFEGQYPDNGISNVHPVAFMGDCRKGEYEIVFGFITTNNPVNDQNVDFSSGWSGELVYSQSAFPLFDDNMNYNYRVQYNPVDGYFYNTVWLRFETYREFDSLCIRSGPTVSNLVHGAFCVNKFVGTVADQLNLDNYQWNYQPTNIIEFNQNNTSTGSAINSADSAEQGFFDNYDIAVSSSGIENFDLSVIGNSLLFVQMLVNRFYAILPDKLQYLIFASLVFGVLAAILGATRYVLKKESYISRRTSFNKKKGD